MQSETGFPSSHQLKFYVASKSRLKLAARCAVSGCWRCCNLLDNQVHRVDGVAYKNATLIANEQLKFNLHIARAVLCYPIILFWKFYYISTAFQSRLLEYFELTTVATSLFWCMNDTEM